MEMNDRTEQAEELWDDLPTDSQHETLWKWNGGAGGETAHGSAEGFRGKTAGPYEETAPVYPDFCCFQLCSGASCPDLRGGSAAQADDSPG